MTFKQANYWLGVALIILIMVILCSWIEHTGARMLSRFAVGLIAGVAINEFWHCVPTSSRTKVRINKTQRKFAQGVTRATQRIYNAPKDQP